MSVNLMKASEARLFAESAENKRNTENLETVVSEIQKAIDLGKLSTTVYVAILPFTRSFLEERGYKIEPMFQRNDSYNDISW